MRVIKMISKTVVWVLYLYTDKGWAEESRHDDKLDAEYSLYEWLDEFPNCKFKIMPEQYNY